MNLKQKLNPTRLQQNQLDLTYYALFLILHHDEQLL